MIYYGAKKADYGSINRREREEGKRKGKEGGRGVIKKCFCVVL